MKAGWSTNIHNVTSVELGCPAGIPANFDLFLLFWYVTQLLFKIYKNYKREMISENNTIFKEFEIKYAYKRYAFKK